MSASAGTFIAAALQTAGQYYQSYVLDLITYSLGGLIVLAFVVGVMACLIGVVLQGGLRSGLLLLLGPALYFAAVFQRTTVPPVEWHQARTPEEQLSVGDSIEGITAETAYVARPSSLFNGYDRLVSGFVSQISDALHTAGEKVDLGLVVKSQLLGFLMTPEITDPGLKELLHLSLLGECRAMIQSGQEMSDPRNRPAERCEWARGYAELATKSTFRVTPNASKYIASLSVYVPELLEAPVVDDLGEELKKVETELANPLPYYGFSSFSCDTGGVAGTPATGDAAEMAERALKSNAYVRNQIMTTVGGGTVNGSAVGLPRSAGSVEALSGYFDDKEDAVNKKVQELSSENFSCHEMWNIAYVALHYEAAMSLETVKAAGEKQGFDSKELLADLAAMSGVEGTRELIRAISRKLFRLENARGSASAIIQEYANRGPDIKNIEVNDSEDINARIRQDTLDAEWTGQGSLIQTAMMLPYYQGLVLFFLSITFPFFAFLLAIPGRALGFCMWFGLWFWVKSWDIGYALVSMLDRVMYSIFVVKMDSGYITSKTMLDMDFSSAVAALRDVDPTFEVGTYYNIMGVCLMAVPIVSAQLVVQVAGGLASIVRGQLLNAQNQGARVAGTLRAQGELGSGVYGDITAKALSEASRMIPLQRPLNSVTVIEDNVAPTVLPTRTPNLIATSGRRSPSVLPSPTNKRLPADGHNHLIPRREVSRWDMIDYSQDLNDPELIDSTKPDDATKSVESTPLPRLPEK